MPFQKNIYPFVSVSYKFQIVKLLNSSLGQLASSLFKGIMVQGRGEGGHIRREKERKE